MNKKIYDGQAMAALEVRAKMIDELRAIQADGTLSGAAKNERTERLEAKIAEKEAEAREAIEAGEHADQVRELVERSGALVRPAGASSEVRTGQPLRADQSFSGASGNASASAFGEYLRGLISGESRSLAGGNDSKGGFLVPTTYSASVLDLARAATRTVQAGAQVIPLSSDDQRIAKLVKDPVPAWRTEAAALAVDDLTLGEVRFQAKSMAVLVKASWELVEDADNLGNVVRDSLARAFAVNLDSAVLYGTGVSPMPLGVRNTSGVTITPVGANGGALTWDVVLPAVQAVRAANYDVTGIVLAERSEAKLASIKDGQGAYLAPPAYLANVPRFTTGLVPVNMTQGTATNASDLFVGDFSKVAIGVRTQFELKVLQERYADTGEVGFVGWLRADVQVLRPDAFQVISGVNA